MDCKVRKRKVLEIPSRLAFAITRRVFVANELRDTDIVVESVENLDASNPRLLIRVKRLVKRVRKRHLVLPEASDWKEQYG